MTSKRSTNRSLLVLAIALALVAVAAIGSYLALNRRRGLPSPGTEAYEQTTRRFYRGLAGLQVGLVDAARQEFTEATTLAPGEPAVWANLGLSQLRLGEFDAAGTAIERAAALAPASGDIAFLRGRLETSRGRREEGIVHLRRAVELDPRSLQARTALIQEIENAGGPNADAEAQQLLEELLTLQPDNVAVLVERARLAAKRTDAALLQDSVQRLEKFASTWPPEVVERYRALQQASGGRGRARDCLSSQCAGACPGVSREPPARDSVHGADCRAFHPLPAAAHTGGHAIGRRRRARLLARVRG